MKRILQSLTALTQQDSSVNSQVCIFNCFANSKSSSLVYSFSPHGKMVLRFFGQKCN